MARKYLIGPNVKKLNSESFLIPINQTKLFEYGIEFDWLKEMDTMNNGQWTTHP